jgi:hypothetical protein
MALAVTGPQDSTYGSSDTRLSQGDRRHQRPYHRGRQPLRDIHRPMRQRWQWTEGRSLQEVRDSDSLSSHAGGRPVFDPCSSIAPLQPLRGGLAARCSF